MIEAAAWVCSGEQCCINSAVPWLSRETFSLCCGVDPFEEYGRPGDALIGFSFIVGLRRADTGLHPEVLKTSAFEQCTTRELSCTTMQGAVSLSN